MISIIISSVNAKMLSAVKKNIADTIGVPYEVISFDNASGKRGLCEIYNSGVSKARYDLLCFMHEDVEILTTNWGDEVAEIMGDETIGLLGVAGSSYKSLTPGGWACPGIEAKTNKVNIIQRYKYSEGGTKKEYFNSENEQLSQVATIDGVWMCTRKSITDSVKFDEQTLPLFHGYDVDISLQVAKEHKVVVTFNILLDHFSEGNYSTDWLKSAMQISLKHQQCLPLNISGLDAKASSRGEKMACRALLKMLSAEKYSAWAKVSVLWNFKLYRVLGFGGFLSFNFKILIGRY
ncbi:glycosyltransferase [Pedobacter frigidisoli]|uniref:glycosyltransferase n=1 Tax=Pedobacter frigidisoli TaxID=2530455 RepID=UPI002931545F|nr:glycosyltransferase [Pedobacter frigidisoli]